MFLASRRRFGPFLQLYIREDLVVLRVPKGKIQVLCPNRASYRGRRAIGHSQPAWEHPHFSYNSMFHGRWRYRWIDHLVLLW